MLCRIGRRGIARVVEALALDRSQLLAWAEEGKALARRVDDETSLREASGTNAAELLTVVNTEPIPWFALELPDVRLIGPHGIPVTRLGRIVLEPVSYAFGTKMSRSVLRRTVDAIGLFELCKQYLLAVFPMFSSGPEIEVAAHCIPREPGTTGTHNERASYGHWIMEHVAQARVIQEFEVLFGYEIPLILNQNPESFQIESIAAAFGSPRQVLQAPRTGVRVRRLIVSSMHTAHSAGNETSAAAMNWIRDRLSSITDAIQLSATDDYPTIPNRVAILRENMPTRRLSNIGEVTNCLQNYMFWTLETGELSLPEEVQRLSNTQTLLAVSGSAIVKVLMSRSIMNLVVISDEVTHKWSVWRDLAFALGLRYFDVPAVRVPDSIPHASSFEPGTWIVDVEVLENVLRDCM